MFNPTFAVRFLTNSVFASGKFVLGAALLSGCVAGYDDDEGFPSEQEEPIDSVQQPVSMMHGTRPLLLVVMKNNASSQLEETFDWYKAKVFGTTKPYVTDYFNVSSRGRFKFTQAGAYLVTNPGTAAFDQRAGVVSSDSSSVKAMKRARMLARDAGFSYSSYDTNGNGTVTTSELTVLVISDAVGGGKQSAPCVTHPEGTKVCSGTAYSGDADAPQNMVHELAHTIGADDMYGAWGVSCHSYRQTIMSCTSGSSLAEQWYNFDPWHRDKLGWTVNGQWVVGSSGSGTLAIAHEASTFGKKYETIELVNSASTSQSLVLERRSRTGTYDKQVQTEGVVAWYVHEHSNNEQIRLIPSLEDPTKNDKANFVLAPVDCVLDPNNPDSRGEPGALKSGSSYRFKWRDGSDAGYLITVGSVNSQGLVPIEYEKTSAAPSCD